MATDGHRNGIVPGSDWHTPTVTSVELAATVTRQRARHVALMLMAAFAVMIVGILLLLWWLASVVTCHRSRKPGVTPITSRA